MKKSGGEFLERFSFNLLDRKNKLTFLSVVFVRRWWGFVPSEPDAKPQRREVVESEEAFWDAGSSRIDRRRELEQPIVWWHQFQCRRI